MVTKNASSKSRTDGYGQVWKYIRTPTGRNVRVRVESDHEEIELEQKEIWEQRRDMNSFFWPSVALGFALNLIVLCVLVGGAAWVFSNASPSLVASIVSAAYVSGLVATYASAIGGRVNRMELHALTVHESVLRIQDSLNGAREKDEGPE